MIPMTFVVMLLLVQSTLARPYTEEVELEDVEVYWDNYYEEDELRDDYEENEARDPKFFFNFFHQPGHGGVSLLFNKIVSDHGIIRNLAKEIRLGDDQRTPVTAPPSPPPPSSEWEYSGRLGIEFWGSINPNCLGSAQSPINVDTSQLDVRTGGKKIQFMNYELVNQDTTELENNGHTVELKVLDPSGKATMYGGHLRSSYEMLQLHFHWAAVDGVGSEHTIDRQAYPLEMHLVHLSTNIPKDQKGGLAVAGFVFEIQSSDNPAIEPIIASIPAIKHSDSHVKLATPFDVRTLVSSSWAGPYYSYEGSLTTPGCDEVVEWVLFKQPLAISSKQLAFFRTILDSGGDPITFNFRPVQPLNNRNVQFYQ